MPAAIVPLIAFDPAAGPLYRQVYDGYRAAILDGRLRAGQRVPSTRALARELGISRLPVLNAFEQLLHEGYLEGRAGSGTFVAALIPDQLGTALPARLGRSATRDSAMPPVASTRAAPSGSRVAPRRDPQPNASTELDPAQSGLGAFRVSLPALDRFPRAAWARLVSRHARRMPVASMAYGDAAGDHDLREAIAHYLRTARALDCDAAQVLIVPGSQMALHLCARVLLAPGDALCIEDPCYPGARQALGATGARLRPVPVDADGLVVAGLDDGDGDADAAARAVYVTPSHQYPLGVSMHAARRLELLEWARRHRAWIIEDDYDSEYRYASRPLGALQGMDQGGRVVYVGTFSKVLFPALRIGYVVAPPALVEAFLQQRRALDLFPPTLYQLALTDFIREGHFARHVRRMRTVYRQRRDALVDALQRRLGDVLSVVNADAGMHLAAWLPAHVDDRAVVECAVRRGVSAIALSSCYAGTPRSGLVLGFGGAPEAQTPPAVDALAAAIDETMQRRCE